MVTRRYDKLLGVTALTGDDRAVPGRIRPRYGSLTTQARRPDVALEIRCGSHLIGVITYAGHGGLWLDTTNWTGKMPARHVGVFGITCRCARGQHVLNLDKVHDTLPVSGRRRVSARQIEQEPLD